MKPYSLLLAVPALVAGLGVFLSAQEASDGGTVLILKTQRVLEGDRIDKVGAQYRIRRGGAEFGIPAGQVLRLCRDRDDARRWMQAQANLHDPDERVRLARWCQTNQMLEFAQVEAKAALVLRPKHAESVQLLKSIDLGLASARAKAPTKDNALPPVPNLYLNFESMKAFTATVQPILMNTCVDCHSAGKGGKFQLLRAFEGGQNAASQRNLKNVMDQVSIDRPAASPLLVMALSPHGNGDAPPIPSRQAPTFVALATWIDRTLADNPHLLEKTVLPTVAAAPKAPAPTADVVSSSVPRIEPQAVPPAPAVKAEPPRPAPPADEFDPVIFNRQAHPER